MLLSLLKAHVLEGGFAKSCQSPSSRVCSTKEKVEDDFDKTWIPLAKLVAYTAFIGIDHYSQFSKAENCCSLERLSVEGIPTTEVRVWDWAFQMIKTQKFFVSLIEPMQISY
ncbi:hypothetical protein AMTR_s00251p00013890 [Amborella trichopoda]|uniref:Uncharacterized protein n=1 Tax=Amborella trichopoda TaxID=13333 RepID=W1NNS8_AMBTC|nr:hypothetical protein AMTR_s00251p00013890 [Amborella trichopoda]